MAVVLGNVLFVPLEEVINKVSDLRDVRRTLPCFVLNADWVSDQESLLAREGLENLKVVFVGLADASLKGREVGFLFQGALMGLVVLLVAAEEALVGGFLSLETDAVELGAFIAVEPPRTRRALDRRALGPTPEARLRVLMHKR